MANPPSPNVTPAVANAVERSTKNERQIMELKARVRELEIQVKGLWGHAHGHTEDEEEEPA